MQYFFQDILNK